MEKGLPLLQPESVIRDMAERGAAPMTQRVQRAMLLAEEVHAGETHWSGLSTLQHLADVLRELSAFHPDEDAIIACLLHHALETKRITLPELEAEFGSTVRELVSGVHLLSQVQVQRRRSSIEHLRLMLPSVAGDVRVVLMLLCDRLCLLERLPSLSPAERRWTAQNALQLFAPVAARLGIHALKQRMEALAFPVLYPTDAQRITEQLRTVSVRGESFLPQVAQALQAALREAGVAARVESREKLPYSVFLKMKDKSITHVTSLYDLYAVRIVTQSEEDCYRALGLAHRQAKAVQNRFKDYIAFPKPNGYRSLHTTVVGLPGAPDGVFVEVQVRTEEMQLEAEYGVAAHWGYKEWGSARRVADAVQLTRMLALQEPVEEVGALASAPSRVRLVDHIYVLTPAGDIVELPEGATPLDFAFQIHTDLGLAFKAARVNGAVVPLTHALENGDVVEVQRHRTPHPSPEWLHVVRMASSRSRLKRFLYAQNRDGLVARGRELVNEELIKLHLPPLDAELTLLRQAGERPLTLHEREDLLLKVGQGSERPGSVLQQVQHAHPQRPAARRVRRSAAAPTGSSVLIEDGVPLPIRFAQCCKANDGTRPVIDGLIGRAGRVMIHRRGCRMIRGANAERRVKVRWR